MRELLAVLLPSVIKIAVLIVYAHSMSYLRNAPENRWGLWIAAAKGFEGPVRYVGSEGDYAYFRTGSWICGRYKAPTHKMALPRTFNLGQSDPYPVTTEMVPRYP